MRHTDLTHRRNIILLCLIVFYYVIQISINVVMEGLESVFPPAFLFMGATAFLFLLVIKKINPVITMYMIVLFIYIYFLFLLTDSPYLVNYLFMWLGLPLSAVYQNYRVLWLSTTFSLLLSLYAIFSFREEIFGSVVKDDTIYFPLFGLFLIGLFFLMMKENRIGEHLKKLAYYDPLTGSANRHMLQEHFESLQKKGENIAILFIDLNFFKQINDQYGHDFGDRLLQKISERMEEEISTPDLLCRVGGDEFIILLSCADEGKLHTYTNRIYEALSMPFSIDEEILFVTASIGKSEIVESRQASLQTLIQQADMEMYKMKSEENHNVDSSASLVQKF